MIISISGALGSGKSTLAKMLAAKLGWPRYYMGGLRRDKAKKLGLTLAEYNKLGETDPRTDLEVDEYQEKLGKTKDNFVIEGRTSWHFIPHSFKIFIDVAEKIGADRIYQDIVSGVERNEDKNLTSPEDALKSVRDRLKSDKLRYKKYFNIDVYDKNNYDFVLDTTNLSINESFAALYIEVKKQQKKG